MKKVKIYYRTKKYGTWKEDEVESNIPDLSIQELLHISQQQIDEEIKEVQTWNPLKN